MSNPQQISSRKAPAGKKPSRLTRIRNWWSGPHQTWSALNRAVASPHKSITEIGAKSRASLQSWIALVLAIFFLMGGVASTAALGGFRSSSLVLIVLFLVMALTYGLSRSRYYSWAGWLITGSVVITGYGFSLSADASSTALYSFIPLAFILGSILLSPWELFFWVVVGVSALFFIPASYGLDTGTAVGVFITLGGLLLVSVIFRNNVERERLAELRAANESLQQFQTELEKRVEDRTRALRTSTEVSRSLSTILDQKQLVKEVVNQVQSTFDYYHVHIYLLDESSGDLVMAGGTGDAGATMLARGHKVLKGRGLVGRAASTNLSVLVPDTSKDKNWLPNPLLPETKAEIAVPIAISDRVLGVLDVQQNVVDGLTREDMDLLQSIANQVAIAVRNARFYEESRSQAEFETLINVIGQKIQRAATVEDVLQTAIREMGVALGASRVSASLTPVRTEAEAVPAVGKVSNLKG